jgi:hypothetical protein
MDRRTFLTSVSPAALAFLVPVIARRMPVANWLSTAAGRSPDIYDGAPSTAGDIEDLRAELEHCGSLEDAAELLCRSGTIEDVAQTARELGMRPAEPMTVYVAHNSDTPAEMLVSARRRASRVSMLHSNQASRCWTGFARYVACSIPHLPTGFPASMLMRARNA